MKILNAALSAFVGSSLIAAPIAAQAATAANARHAAPVSGEELRGGFVIPLVALIAIILGVLAIALKDGDETRPHSP